MDSRPLTISELREIVAKAGFPQTLLIHHSLFAIVSSLMVPPIPVDVFGEYVVICDTKIRPGLPAELPRLVDLSESRTVFDVEYY